MIHTLSSLLVDYLQRNNCLTEDKDIYIHGARIFISTMIGTVLLFMIGLLTHHIIDAILYELLISSSRSILGGYHCKSYRSCIVLYIVMFMMGLFFIKYIHINIYMLILIEVFGLLITLLYCPVDNVNKKVSIKKKRIFKKYSIIYTIIYLVAMNMMFYLNINYINIIIYIFINIQFLTIGGRIDYELYQK